jgi:hypothetical protein
MSLTRDVARKLAQAKEIEVLQRGSPIDPCKPVRGPIRLRLKEGRRANHEADSCLI